VAEYRIEFSIQRRDDDAEDFVEIGFGSSGATGSPDQAAYEMESVVQNRLWETSEGMPDPQATPTEETP
jgi:hypothetical protein